MPEESTTPDPVALTRRFYAALNRRDFEALVSLLGPASVVDASRGDLGTHTGPEAIRRFAEEWLGNLSEYRVKVEEIHDLGNGVVYVLQLGHRAHGPHAYVELRSSPVFVWEEGLVAQIIDYTDIDEARAAAERLALR